jgi:hypothetical protein
MTPPTGKQILAGITIIVVVTVVVIGIVLLGPPEEERARRLDQRRVRDLQGVEFSVREYWMTRGRLPSSLDEVSKASADPGYKPGDPVTGAPYGYRVLDDKSYELCATFDRESPREARNRWAHGAGMRCFTRRAGDPGE